MKANTKLRVTMDMELCVTLTLTVEEARNLQADLKGGKTWASASLNRILEASLNLALNNYDSEHDTTEIK